MLGSKYAAVKLVGLRRSFAGMLYPLFALILGYIFGSNKQSSDSSSS